MSVKCSSKCYSNLKSAVPGQSATTLNRDGVMGAEHLGVRKNCDLRKELISLDLLLKEEVEGGK